MPGQVCDVAHAHKTQFSVSSFLNAGKSRPRTHPSEAAMEVLAAAALRTIRSQDMTATLKNSATHPVVAAAEAPPIPVSPDN